MQYDFVGPVERAVEVLLFGPLDVVRHEDVDASILVVVDPCGARAEVRVRDARPLGDVTELEIAFVPEQAIPLERRHVHVVSAVIVVIAHGDAHAVHLDIQPAGRGDIGERAVLVIAIQGVKGALGAGLPVPRVDQEHVGPAVAIGVQKRGAGPERLRQELLAGAAAVVDELDAGSRGHIRERHGPGRGRRGGNQTGTREGQQHRDQLHGHAFRVARAHTDTRRTGTRDAMVVGSNRRTSV